MEDIFKPIIERRVLDLLKIISINYPTQFARTQIKDELKYIMEHINFKDTHQELLMKIPETTDDKSKTTNVKKKNISLKNGGGSDNGNGNGNSNINLCNARVWSFDIIRTSDKKRIKEIDRLFRVDNYKKLDIDKFVSRYSIGRRCGNKIDNSDGGGGGGGGGGSNKYCKLHKKHLIHGDYFEKPSQEICYHFLKDCKLI
jgi:hypothetical protein